MPTSLNEYRLDDATITKLTVEDAVARMMVRNWQDETHVLVFEDVVPVSTSFWLMQVRILPDQDLYLLLNMYGKTCLHNNLILKLWTFYYIQVENDHFIL